MRQEESKIYFCKQPKPQQTIKFSWPDWTNYNGQAYSCLRDWRLSASWRSNSGPSWSLSNITALWYRGNNEGLLQGAPEAPRTYHHYDIEGLMGALNETPIMWRGTSLSKRQRNFFQSGTQRRRFLFFVELNEIHFVNLYFVNYIYSQLIFCSGSNQILAITKHRRNW